LDIMEGAIRSGRGHDGGGSQDEANMESVVVYLVPGIFGFTSLGTLSYFHRVGDTLRRLLRDLGLEATVVECPTQPAGSIRRRAERLRSHIAETGGLKAKSIHMVGHSTGGLDVRLLLSPGVRVAALGPGDGTEETIGSLTRSAVTISTPHHGTPLASFFASVQGRRLLETVAARAASVEGRATIVALARTVSMMARVTDFVGIRGTVISKLSEALLRKITFDSHDPLWAFLREISTDQGIIVQLTPESLNLFGAVVVDRPSVVYSSIVTAAPTPPSAYRGLELLSPERAVLATVFVALHTLTSMARRHYPYPAPTPEQRAVIEAGIPFPIDRRTNDGVVPTMSQIEGRLLTAVVADHLDVVGQFAREGEPLSDWLPSGAHFDQESFDSLWGIVAGEIARTEHDRWVPPA
jgi:triacylglycerol esterase/lipase EstA (alpha/beta hydrolase family)